MLTVAVFGALSLSVASATSRRSVQWLEAALAAHGGRTRVRRLRFARLRGRWSILGRGGVVRAESIRLHAGPCGFRACFSGPAGKRLLVVDGAGGWVRRGPVLQKLSRLETCDRLFELNPVVGVCNGFLDGRLRLPSPPVHHPREKAERIRLLVRRPPSLPSGASRGGGPRRSYALELDHGSGRIVRLVASQETASDSSSRFETISFGYGDFRRVRGVLMPYRIEIDNGPTPYALVQLDHIVPVSAPPDVRAP